MMDVHVIEQKRIQKVQTAIYLISEVAQTAKNLDELYRSIHSIIGDLMPARNFYVALYDATTGLLHFPYFEDEFDSPPSPLKPGKSLTGYVLRTGKALLATPATFEQMVESGELALIGAPSVDWLGVPLKTHAGETIGVMVVQTYTESTRLTEADKDVLVFVSTQVAMAVERKRVEERIAKLGHLKEKLLGTSSLNEKLKLITDSVVSIFGADFARIWIIKGADLCNTGCQHAAITEGAGICHDRFRCLHLMASSGRYVHIDGGHRRVPLDCYKIGRIASGKESNFIINDVTNEPSVHDPEWARSLGLVSFAGHRLISNDGRPIGVLALFRKLAIAPHEEKLLEDLANSTSQVILAGAAEEALRESQRAMSTLLSNLQGMAYRCRNDRQWTMEFVSQGSLALTGCLPEQLVGNALVAYGNLVHPEDRASVWEGVQAALAKKVPFELLYRITPPDGTTKWVWEQGCGIYQSDGTLIALEGFISDITKRKQTEEEMHALQEQLRQSQKIEAVGRLAGGIAHDFNNLLTVIRGCAELALLDLESDSPIREDIKGIQKAANRAAELTRQLLAFSRRQVMQMEVLNLNALLLDLDKMLHRVIGEDIEVITALDKDLGRVKADPGQIEQVIMNLAVNARDAMPTGGKLTIETANVELDEAYGRRHAGMAAGSYVMLSVSDTGVGMTPEVKERVFEPFFTTKEKDKGTGLGLSTVYGIVKQSGGYIWVYSEPGLGTTFKIYLVREDGSAEERKNKVESAEILRGDETILVVEDDSYVRELAMRILEKQGYRVMEASSGEAALGVYKTFGGQIHLILTDVVMPRMSGKELVDRLQPLRNGTRVLYMSGYPDNSIVSHDILAKGTHYIQKPFTMESLSRTVRATLDRHTK